MSAFEPEVVLAIILNSLHPSKRDAFETNWRASVKHRSKKWLLNRPSQWHMKAQLEWEASVVEYVIYVYDLTKLHGNAKKSIPPTLPPGIPHYGPRFIPPTYTQLSKRENAPRIKPEVAYLRPLNVVHPFYYDNLKKCPQCGSVEVLWDSWTNTGHRRVHGVRTEESAIGYQLRCKVCEKRAAAQPEIQASSAEGSDPKTIQHCFATTSAIFWDKWEHWEIPRGIPIFTQRCGVTRELFDLIIELRPSSTSGGLAENIRQLHLLEFRMRELEHLRLISARRNELAFNSSLLKPLLYESSSDDIDSYNDKPISDDFITDIWLKFSKETREAESAEYMKSLAGRVYSIDNTFKASAKATIVDGKNQGRTNVMKGGILTCIDENNGIDSWRLCQTQGNAELEEMMRGIYNRHVILGIPMPEMFVADNCCHVRGAIQKIFPGAHVCLDVFHLLGRYLAAILNGTKNPCRGAVAKDVVDAILKNRAGEDGHKFARYRNRAEQEEKLQAMYEKWAKHGDVWSRAAAKVHADQLGHVKKGCLERTREDLACDGSRIEGSHKSWNSIMRSYASGIEVFTSLGHDLTLRRNLRMAASIIISNTSPAYLVHTKAFAASILGSHHVRLANATAKLWNTLAALAVSKPAQRLLLRSAAVYETFGLVSSKHNSSFGGLLQMKEESDEEDGFGALDPGTGTISHLNIDPLDLHTPLSVSSMPTASTSALTHVEDVRAVPTATTSASPSTGNAITIIDDSIARQTTPAHMQTLDSKDAKSVTGNMLRAMSTAGPSVSTKRKLEPSLEGQTSSPERAPALKRICIEGSLQKSGTSGSGLFSLFASSPHTENVVSAPSKRDHGQRAASQALGAELLSPLPPPSSPSKLTPSEHLFLVSTLINPRSLKIGDDIEFFAFMDLRAQHKWTSFGMTSRMWVKATADYNALLATRCRAQGLPDPLLKHPRALVEKLGEVETTIVRRVATKDFKSKSGGSEDFWRRHCGVISLVKIDPGTTSEKNSRKLPMCARCKQMKYPGGTGSAANHRRDYCSDGVRCTNKLKAGTDIIPDWPQPPGIFTSGSKFHAIEFLKALRDLHEKTVNNDSSDVVIDLEGLAFAKMFQTRTIKADDSAGGMYLFRLFDNLEMIPALPELVVNYNNLKYLRLDCLGGASSPASAADTSAAEVPIGEGGEGLEGELVDF